MRKFAISLLILNLTFQTLNSFGQVDFSATQVCKGKTTVLTGTSVLNDSLIQSWNWDLDSDGSFDDAGGKLLNYNFQNEGNLTVGLKIILKSGMQDSMSKTVTVFPLPDVTYTAENVCQGNPVMFDVNAMIASGMVVQYKWDFENNGQFAFSNTDTSFGYFLAEAKNYIINMQAVSEKGCLSPVYTNEVKVYNSPHADFSTQGELRAKESIQFNNTTILSNENLLTCLWNFGDNQTASGINNVSHAYNTAGIFNVSMIAVSENNCADTVYAALNIDEAIVVIPPVDTTSGPGKKSIKNILTPNADGNNDFLLIEEVALGKNCELTIYNQWNEVVFSNSAYDNKWDGQDLKTGTYFYMLNCGGERRTGSVSILK